MEDKEIDNIDICGVCDFLYLLFYIRIRQYYTI